MPRAIAILVLVLLLATGSEARAAAGALDPSFGTDGVVLLAGGRLAAHATDVKVLPDGRILVAVSDRVRRLLPTGETDRTFGRRGTSRRLRIDARRLAIQPDGRIVVGGMSGPNSPLLVGRLTADGRRDYSFGRNGTVSIDERPHDQARQVAIDPQGRIVVLFLDTPVGGLLRLLPDGSRDTTFGVNGVVVEPQFAGNAFTALAFQAGGRILAAVGGSLVCFLEDGRRDLTFGYQNSGTIALGKLLEGHRSAGLFPLEGGAIVTVGTRIPFPYTGYDGIHIGHLQPNGYADPSFGSGGYVSLPVGEYSFAAAAARLPDGRLVAVGYGAPDDWQPDVDYFVARFLPDGTPDPSFGNDGVVSSDIREPAYNMSDQARAVAVQADGAIVVAVNVFDPTLTAETHVPAWAYLVRRLGE